MKICCLSSKDKLYLNPYEILVINITCIMNKYNFLNNNNNNNNKRVMWINEPTGLEVRPQTKNCQ